MTASPRREVEANLLRGAALGSAQARAEAQTASSGRRCTAASAQARAEAQDAGRQDLGDLVQALGGGHEVGLEGVGHPAIGLVLITSYLPTASR
jgi:hypothetical protein